MYLFIHIIVTGNWNFRDFLVICMCIGLLDDHFFYNKKSKNDNSTVKNYLSSFIACLAYSAIIYGTVVLYQIQIQDNWTLKTEIGKKKKMNKNFNMNKIKIK